MVRILGEKYNLEVFSEPHLNVKELYTLETRLKQGTDNFIIKFMPDYVDFIPAYNTIYNSDCYKIKLIRRDKIAQIASHFLASKTGMWNNYKNINMTPYTIDVDNEIIDKSIETIFKNDALLDQTCCDEVMIYEDLDFSNAVISKLIMPDNYQMIYSHIESRVKSKML